MGIRATSYTAEFKASAVQQAIESTRSISQTARDLGINPHTMHSWIGDHRRKVRTENVADDDLGEQVRQLRLENARLRDEVKMLTKATAFFATNACSVVFNEGQK